MADAVPTKELSIEKEQASTPNNQYNDYICSRTSIYRSAAGKLNGGIEDSAEKKSPTGAGA